MFPFAEPTGYGLGKHGWVTFTFKTLTSAIETQCYQWLRESYLAVAPKSIAKTIADESGK
jgi:hypothetical protein